MTGSSLHNIVHSGDSSSPQSSTNIDNSNGASTKANSALNFSASPGSTHAAHSMTAREGRENQAYTPEGARLVAGTVIINSTTKQILLISSMANRNKYIIPKGGIELDECSDYRITAVRETWEEAGVFISSLDCLGPELGDELIVNDIPKHLRQKHPFPNCYKCEFHFYELDIQNAKFENEWPEQKQRERIWTSIDDAIDKLEASNRPELLEAVKRCSLYSK